MEIFLSAGANALDNIRGKTNEMLASDRLKEYLVHHPLNGLLQEPAKLADSIVGESEMWLIRYRERGARWFNDEWQYSKAMRELSELERLAVGKIDFFLGGGGMIEEPMKSVARLAEASMIRRLDEMEAMSKLQGGALDAEARELALDLCRRRGVVIKSIDETNDLGESPLVASGARGDVENLGPLLLAGCKLDTASQDKGRTALHMACMMGHLEYARRLADEGADLFQTSTDGRTGLVLAAREGQLNMVKLMLERGGTDLGMKIDTDGFSSAMAAAHGGHLSILQCLYEVCGRDLLMLVDTEGRSCAIAAAWDGHMQVMKYLYEVCGQELLMLGMKDGVTCAYIASINGHLDILEYVHQLCGNELLMLVNASGISCAHAAAMGGHLAIVKYLHKACGVDLLMLLNKDGMSCANAAAFKGHLNVLEYIHEVCGKELLMTVDENGESCALLAANTGHLDALKWLHEACGAELLMLVGKNGISCAYAASNQGHLHIVEYLHDTCGKELLMLVNADGTSCAIAAAVKGHLNVLEYIHKVCGTELLMLVDANGVSCAWFAARNKHLDVLRWLYDACGRELLMLVDKYGRSCAYAAAVNGHLDVVEYLHEACGTELLKLSPDHTNLLAEAVGNDDMYMLLARLGGLELVSVKDTGGWTVLHQLVYGGRDAFASEIASISKGETLLEIARREVAEYDSAIQTSNCVVHRGYPSLLKMDHAVRTVEYLAGFDTVRSRRMCPCGSRGYFELEIISLSREAQFGFANAEFAAIRGRSHEGVGDDSFSWAVDGARKRKWHGGGAEEWDCNWRDGDVIGFACDLVEGKMHVSLNGDFSAPNDCMFDIDTKNCKGLFAAFTAGNGKVRYNLGEAAFAHRPPTGSDYTAFHDFPLVPLQG